MANRLADKITIITGATSGIGEATARRFIEDGATVVLAGRSRDKGEALADELGERALFKRTDIMSEDDIAALVDFTVERFGRLDCLFNNAGAGDRTTVDSFDEQEFARIMRLLVGAPAFGVKHAARVMKDNGGSIINNASIAGHRLNQGGYLYSGAKAAVAHMTRLAGAELGPFNIRVNAISPGAVATPIFWGGSERAQGLSDEENQRKMEKLQSNLAKATPLPRAGLADDIAHAAAFLASDEGSFINSHDLVVDGGRIAMFNEKG
ncbi:MAG: short-chain dehydrogenase [Alcanivorax sp.]|nr:short-chain dehydrogenase [Alcanivorax sp.]MAY11634.1 short-chain dehydrogenase [Alcanivorax sp.]MBI53050.1 short-chain dehydrogenase [Alcanivorax sp.]MBU58809.1 short-chain dehydrogenase [Alcanivorax sp.]MBU60319.1 short-chain dehydrogenase [Alcanivorax sp.]|tara:strand:- start:28452 stop:29249 length:798 start_codon:yes stop_codon:yes gene_type:complete